MRRLFSSSSAPRSLPSSSSPRRRKSKQSSKSLQCASLWSFRRSCLFGTYSQRFRVRLRLCVCFMCVCFMCVCVWKSERESVREGERVLALCCVCVCVSGGRARARALHSHSLTRPSPPRPPLSHPQLRGRCCARLSSLSSGSDDGILCLLPVTLASPSTPPARSRCHCLLVGLLPCPSSYCTKLILASYRLRMAGTPHPHPPCIHSSTQCQVAFGKT